MNYETHVQLLPGSGYLEAFWDFSEIKNRTQSLIPAEGDFREALRELSGDDVWEPIAKLTEALFGAPERVLVFEDNAALRGELEGPEGFGPFFFIFDLMFCEYGDYTLCFISGTNN
jgi:hypothetical protein